MTDMTDMTDTTLNNLPDNHLSITEIDAIANEIGDLMATAESSATRIEKAKDSITTTRERIAEALYPALDRICGLTPGSRCHFDTNIAKRNVPDFEPLRIAICRQMSARLKEQVVQAPARKDGTMPPPQFSGRVTKAWQRITSSYKSGGAGEQTQADKAAREAEKERKVQHKAMAMAMADLIKAYAAAPTDPDAWSVQVAAAASRWPEQIHSALFPAKGGSKGA